MVGGVFQCHFCEYESKHRAHIRRHLEHVHKAIFKMKPIFKYDQSERIPVPIKNDSNVYQCYKCVYKTKQVHHITRHLTSVHKAVFEITSDSTSGSTSSSNLKSNRIARKRKLETVDPISLVESNTSHAEQAVEDFSIDL